MDRRDYRVRIEPDYDFCMRHGEAVVLDSNRLEPYFVTVGKPCGCGGVVSIGTVHTMLTEADWDGLYTLSEIAQSSRADGSVVSEIVNQIIKEAES